ncbi:MAG: GxxExxY protein [Gemmatimonadales bacterium]
MGLLAHSTTAISDRVIGAAIQVHRALGPGLLESAYRQCLSWELTGRGIDHRMEVPIAVNYRGQSLAPGYRIDMLVEDVLVVELKSVQKVLDIHQAQVLTYLKLGGYQAGLIINFNVPVLKDGLKRLLH